MSRNRIVYCFFGPSSKVFNVCTLAGILSKKTKNRDGLEQHPSLF